MDPLVVLRLVVADLADQLDHLRTAHQQALADLQAANRDIAYLRWLTAYQRELWMPR